MDLEEPIAFDTIRRCFYVSVYLVVVMEVYNVIIIFRGSSAPALC